MAASVQQYTEAPTAYPTYHYGNHHHHQNTVHHQPQLSLQPEPSAPYQGLPNGLISYADSTTTRPINHQHDHSTVDRQNWNQYYQYNHHQQQHHQHNYQYPSNAINNNNQSNGELGHTDYHHNHHHLIQSASATNAISHMPFTGTSAAPQFSNTAAAAASQFDSHLIDAKKRPRDDEYLSADYLNHSSPNPTEASIELNASASPSTSVDHQCGTPSALRALLTNPSKKLKYTPTYYQRAALQINHTTTSSPQAEQRIPSGSSAQSDASQQLLHHHAYHQHTTWSAGFNQSFAKPPANQHHSTHPHRLPTNNYLSPHQTHDDSNDFADVMHQHHRDFAHHQSPATSGAQPPASQTKTPTSLPPTHCAPSSMLIGGHHEPHHQQQHATPPSMTCTNFASPVRSPTSSRFVDSVGTPPLSPKEVELQINRLERGPLAASPSADSDHSSFMWSSQSNCAECKY